MWRDKDRWVACCRTEFGVWIIPLPVSKVLSLAARVRHRYKAPLLLVTRWPLPAYVFPIPSRLRVNNSIGRAIAQSSATPGMVDAPGLRQVVAVALVTMASHPLWVFATSKAQPRKVLDLHGSSSVKDL